MSHVLDENTLELLHNYSGQHGISNFGTTCFINSVLQCLCNVPQLMIFFFSGAAMSHVKVLKKHLRIKQKSTDVSQGSLLLIELFDEFIKSLRTNTSNPKIVVSPKKLILYIENLSVYQYKNGILNEPFVRVNMGDSHEFLTFILNQLHEELKIPVKIEIDKRKADNSSYSKFHHKSLETFKSNFEKSYSVIIDIFYGQFGLQIYNPMDRAIKGISRMTFDPFNTLSLTIPENSNRTKYKLSELLDYFFEETKPNYTLQDDDGYNQANMVLKQCFWTLPKVLIINIKRYNANNQNINGYSVIFPEILDVSSYYRTGFHEKKNHEVNSHYTLIGCIHHIGNSIQGGHYFADCKNVHSQWFRYDDTSVNKIDYQTILTTSSHSVYQLFYFKL